VKTFSNLLRSIASESAGMSPKSARVEMSCLRVSAITVHAGTNEDLDMIADSMGVRLAPSSLSAFALRRVEATVVSASPEGLSTVIDALSAMTRKPSPGLEGYNDIASDPRFAAGMPPAPLSPDELVLPTLGDMRAGWFVADDEEGLDGDSRVAVCASVH
jgi:hypothetical protein